MKSNDAVIKYMESIKHLMGHIKSNSKKAIKKLGGNLDKEAHEGDPAAKYIAYSEELNYYLKLQLEVEQALCLTKKTSARRKLLRKKMLIQQEILYYQRLQDELLGKEPVIHE